MQLLLISLLSSLPGLLYFQYERQRVTTLREKFLREIMLLNPSVHTQDDAEIMYGSMVDEVSGIAGANNRQYFLLGAGRPILLASLLVTLGWLLIMLPIGEVRGLEASALYQFFTPVRTAVGFAFLGTYFFALNLIFRRYARDDLTPKAYTHITVRILSSLILVWVISMVVELAWGSGQGNSWILLVIAFGVGIFPESGLAILEDAVQKRGLGYLFRSLREQHPITQLEGVNVYDYVRLLEEGVENIENLAHFNLIELMLRSRLPTSRLVDLVDQAILFLHVWGALGKAGQVGPNGQVGSNGHANRRDQDLALQTLRSYGIRTATDLLRVMDSTTEGPQLQNLLGSNNDGLKRLDVIRLAIQDDEWLDYLQYWRELNKSLGKVYGWEDFYSDKDMRSMLPASGSSVSTPAQV